MQGMQAVSLGPALGTMKAVESNSDWKSSDHDFINPFEGKQRSA